MEMKIVLVTLLRKIAETDADEMVRAAAAARLETEA